MGLYWVYGTNLNLPGDEFAKPRRLVVVISANATTWDEDWSWVLVCPISSSPDYVTPYCVELKKGQGVQEDCWVRIPAIQFIPKEQLLDFVGTVPADQAEVINAQLAQVLGLI